MRGIDKLRYAVKRMVRDQRYWWLAAPARKFWYYCRTVGELKNVPAVLLWLAQEDTRLKTPTELVDLVFTRFNGTFRPFQNRSELQRS